MVNARRRLYRPLRTCYGSLGGLETEADVLIVSQRLLGLLAQQAATALEYGALLLVRLLVLNGKMVGGERSREKRDTCGDKKIKEGSNRYEKWQ